jgi:hypothetical protein
MWWYLMPQCPICNSAVWVGQRYCGTCDNYLPHPDEKDHFCPQCSIRVAPQQTICHKCKGNLPENGGPPLTAPAWAWRLPRRVLGIFIGSSLILVALLVVFLFSKSPGTSQLMVPPPPAASGQTPATTPIPHGGAGERYMLGR